MNQPGVKLTRKQEAVIAALLTQDSHTKAAEAAGVSRATLSRWMQLPEFQTAYRQARRAVLEHATSQLQAATEKAVATLVRSLDAVKVSDRIRAALGVLDRAQRGLELFDLAEQMNELKEKVQHLLAGEGGGNATPSEDSSGPTTEDLEVDAIQVPRSSGERPWIADPADDEDPEH